MAMAMAMEAKRDPRVSQVPQTPVRAARGVVLAVRAARGVEEPLGRQRAAQAVWMQGAAAAGWATTQ